MNIQYSFSLPDANALFRLYDIEGWNDFLKLPEEILYKAMENSWRVICAYNKDQLIGTGRVVSDGFINAYICGLIVHPDHRNMGIGKEMLTRIIAECEASSLHIQLFAEEGKANYYERQGFEKFAEGLKYISS